MERCYNDAGMRDLKKLTFDEIQASAPPGELYGGIDLEKIERNLALTPFERIQKHYAARMLVARLKKAAEERNGYRTLPQTSSEAER
jgi:hypothetical protein